MGTHTTALRYRPDIDGLRALSVILVIAFHARTGVPGGYLGVDVFFVISGYLITGLILKEIDRGTFTLTNFWERRIRRIWPAAFAVTLGVLTAGSVLMFPNDWKWLATDAIAQVAMLANVQFWRTTGYFDVQAEVRPLLHTWSLAVEEQFYILYPPVLVLLCRAGRRVLRTTLLAVLLLSLIASVVWIERHPSATFYMLHTRAWELMIGGLLAAFSPPAPRSRAASNALTLAGLGLILAPSFLYDASTPFPGFAALPPCIGAAMIIYGGSNRDALASRALGCAPMRTIGLMSYSLYLWHWPVLAFMHYTMGHFLSPQSKAIAIAATCVLSFCSWKLVEQPFRTTRRGPGLRRVATTAALTALLLLAAAMIIRTNEGFPGRFDNRILAYGTPLQIEEQWRGSYSENAEQDEYLIPIGRKPDGSSTPCFLLWGDSHGMAISGIVHEAARDSGIGGYAALKSMSVPFTDVWKPDRGETSRIQIAQWSRDVLDWIERNEVYAVILCSRWSVFVDGWPDGRTDSLIAHMDETTTSRDTAIETIHNAMQRLLDQCEERGVRAWILTEIPYQTRSPQQRAIHAQFSGKPLDREGVALREHEAHQRSVRKAFDNIERKNATFIDLATPIFDGSERSIVTINNRSVYADNDHINTFGARNLLRETLMDIMSEIRSQCESKDRTENSRTPFQEQQPRP